MSSKSRQPDFAAAQERVRSLAPAWVSVLGKEEPGALQTDRIRRAIEAGALHAAPPQRDGRRHISDPDAWQALNWFETFQDPTMLPRYVAEVQARLAELVDYEIVGARFVMEVETEFYRRRAMTWQLWSYLRETDEHPAIQLWRYLGCDE